MKSVLKSAENSDSVHEVIVSYVVYLHRLAVRPPTPAFLAAAAYSFNPRACTTRSVMIVPS